MIQFQENAQTDERKDRKTDRRLDGKTERPYFIGPFIWLLLGVQKHNMLT